ncbi:MAG TPA: PQQ-binding-like beta-propeller repeat protein [Gemmatimonadales bacterium]|nr:PQQ-binding-like beta-propeller repeat protein [Gemmatimonadales bacterium]
MRRLLERSMRIAVAAHCTGTSLAAQSTSPMFRGDPAHTGVSTAPLFQGQGGVHWRFHTGGAIRSTPAVTRTRIYVGSGDGSLYAIDRRVGRLVWRFAAGGAVTSSPALAGRVVIAATHQGRIFAVDQATGRLVWSRQTGPALPPNTYPAGGWDIWASSPVVSGTTAVIGGPDGLVYALEAATGRVRWRAKTGGRVRATPAVSGDLVVVGSWDGRVYALDLATGHERWVHRTIGDTLDSHKFGFDRRALQSSPALAEGKVFVGSRDGGLYGIDARTGERLWRATHRGSWVVGSPAVQQGTVYVGSSDGHFIQAVDATTGTERWRYEAGSNILTSPTLVAGLLLAGTESTESPWGDLLALDQATGTLRWRLRMEEAFFSTPVAVDDMVYLGNDSGDLLAIGQVNPVVPQLAVFYDSTLASRNPMPGSRLAREYFDGLGYTVLDGGALRRFFEARIADQVPSVVVFAMEALPEVITRDTGAAGAWQRYLRSGGKIVWLGTIPGTAVYDSTGTFLGNDLPLSRPLTGLPIDSIDFNEYPSVPTEEGKRWGLSGQWRGDMPAAPGAVTRMLARDTDGWATIWQIEYRKDRPWAGYLQVLGLGATVERLPVIRAVAEYGLVRKAG